MMNLGVIRNMVSVRDWRTLTRGARRAAGSVASAAPKERSEDCDLQDLILGDGEGDVLRKDVEQNGLPAGFVRDGADGLNRGGRTHADAGLGDVDGDRAED